MLKSNLRSYLNKSIWQKTKKAFSLINHKSQKTIEAIEKTINQWRENNKKKCNVLLLGLTNKSNANDLSKSIALHIAKEISTNKTINLFVSDPYVKEEKLIEIFEEKVTSVKQGLCAANIVIFLVAHKNFKEIDKKLLKNKLIIDFCGITYKPKHHEAVDMKQYTTGCILDFFIANSKRSYIMENEKRDKEFFK